MHVTPQDFLSDPSEDDQYLLEVVNPYQSVTESDYTNDVSSIAVLPRFEVSALDDSGYGTLRDMIDQVNNDPNSSGPNSIYFASDISGGTISLASLLPAVQTGQVTIAGPVTIDGNGLVGDGLQIDGSEDSVEALTITNFAGTAIAITGDQNTIIANQIFGDQDGIDLSDGASNNTIGGNVGALANVISGNQANGVDIEGDETTANLVVGNDIGVDADGTPDGNSGVGVLVEQGATKTSVSGNIISDNGDEGILIENDGTSHNLVEGNEIGTDAAGQQAIGNQGDGILIQDGGLGKHDRRYAFQRRQSDRRQRGQRPGARRRVGHPRARQHGRRAR